MSVTFFHADTKTDIIPIIFLFVDLENVDRCTKSHAIWTKITFLNSANCFKIHPLGSKNTPNGVHGLSDFLIQQVWQ